MGCGGTSVSEINKRYFNNELLKYHNDMRKKHNSPELNLNEKLNQIAKEYAKELINSNKIIFSPYTYKGEPLGENIYNSENIYIEPKEVFDQWYNEYKKYDFQSKKFQKEACHFTQIIWKNTKEVGFGIENNSSKIYIVALYFPAGNIFEEFTKNIIKAN